MTAARLHPGSIEHVDLVTGFRSEVPIEKVPEDHRFCELDGSWVPVVRIETSRRDGVRRVVEFGPKGELLRSTVLTSRRL